MSLKELSDLVDMNNPDSVLEEVSIISSLSFPGYDFAGVEEVFKDILRLFRGDYPGYRECNTRYHDIWHTLAVFLAQARMMHGAAINGKRFSEKGIFLGLTGPLLHDTGFIQAADDLEGTGAKYTKEHVRRSIDFVNRYFPKNEYPEEYSDDMGSMLRSTELSLDISGIYFSSEETELLGKLLGTADLIGQMSDRVYLETLPFLYHEFKEAGIEDYKSELDLLKKTPGFYQFIKKRLTQYLDNVYNYARYHFMKHFGIDRNLYMEAIQDNMNYLESILPGLKEEDLRDKLRRSAE